MINKVQSNLNFGSLKISQDKATKEAIYKYVDCMDTARVMSGGFSMLHKQTGEDEIIIRAKHNPNDYNQQRGFEEDTITIEAVGKKNASKKMDVDDYEPIARLKISTEVICDRAAKIRDFVQNVIKGANADLNEEVRHILDQYS